MYRSPPEIGLPCDRHPAAPAGARCGECAAPVCTPCSLYVELRLVCPRCAQRSRRRQRRMKLGARAAIALSFLGGLIAACSIHLRFQGDAFYWGSHADSVHLFQQELAEHPCDPGTLLALAKVYDEASDPWSATQVLDRAALSCRGTPPLLRAVLHHDMMRGAWDQAVDVATRLIAIDAVDRDAWIDRAYGHYHAGHPKSAARDYAAAGRLPSCNDWCLSVVRIGLLFCDSQSEGEDTALPHWLRSDADLSAHAAR